MNNNRNSKLNTKISTSNIYNTRFFENKKPVLLNKKKIMADKQQTASLNLAEQTDKFDKGAIPKTSSIQQDKTPFDTSESGRVNKDEITELIRSTCGMMLEELMQKTFANTNLEVNMAKLAYQQAAEKQNNDFMKERMNNMHKTLDTFESPTAGSQQNSSTNAYEWNQQPFQHRHQQFFASNANYQKNPAQKRVTNQHGYSAPSNVPNLTQSQRNDHDFPVTNNSVNQAFYQERVDARNAQQVVRERGNQQPNFKPRFSNNDNEDPLFFLAELDIYMGSFSNPNHKVMHAIHCFEGAAESWAKAFGILLNSYEEFREAFIENFWGSQVQRKLIRDLETKQYKQMGNKSHMVEYFLKYKTKCQNLDYPLNNEEFFIRFADHFPDEPYGNAIRNIAFDGNRAMENAYRRLKSWDEIINQKIELKRERYEFSNRRYENDSRRNETQQTNNSQQKTQSTEQTTTRNNNFSRNNNTNINSRGVIVVDTANENLSDEILNMAEPFLQDIIEDPLEVLHYVGNLIVDPNNLLEEDNWSWANNIGSSPRIKGNFDHKEEIFWLDSGSEICLISPKLYQNLKINNLILAETQANGLTLKGAFKANKGVKAAVQILVNFKLDEFDFTGIFLVAELRENLDVVLGDNFFRKQKVLIDYEHKQIIITAGTKDPKMIAFLPDLDRQNEEYCVDFVDIKNIYNEEKLKIYDEINSVVKEVVEKTHLNSENEKKFRDILLKHHKVFKHKPGLTNQYKHKIEMINDKPWYKKSFPIPKKLKKEANLLINQMLEWKIIEPANTAYISPLICIAKKDGTVRFAMDLRDLNKQIFMDYLKPVNIDEAVQQQMHAKQRSNIDLTMAYWQIPLEQSSRKYTGFIFENHTYQFRVLPFGIATAVASFTRAMEIILGQKVLKFTTNYVDDFLIASEDFISHLKHLDQLFNKFEEAGLTVHLKKSKFFQSEIKFLGHIINNNGIKPCEEKLHQIADFPAPKTGKQLKSFLGVCSWIRKYIPHLSHFASPLQELSKQNNFVWTHKHQSAFDNLKWACGQQKILSHPNDELQYVLQTDSSYLGLAAVLFQFNEKGEKNIIQFASRSLKGPEIRYGITDLEALSIIFAVKKFNFYLFGAPFLILTDHKALTFLKECRPSSNRLMRFVLFLQQYDFKIKHIAGKDNILADFLSRNPSKTSEKSIIKHEGQNQQFVSVLKINLETDFQNKIKNMSKLQNLDENIVKLKISQLTNKKQYLALCEDVLFKKINEKWLIIIPHEMIIKFLEFYHDNHGHFGVYKTYKLLAETFTARNLKKTVKAYINSCKTCQKTKYSCNKKIYDFRPVVTEHAGDLVSVDVFGPLPTSRGGVKYVLVMLDTFTKLTRLFTMKKATTKVILAKYLIYFESSGKPQRILSDLGTQFSSPIYKKQLNDWKIICSYSSVRHPVANPVERTMKELGRLCRAYCANSHKSWATWIVTFEKWLNNVEHLITKQTPENLHFGNNMSEVRASFHLPQPDSVKIIESEANENIKKAIQKRMQKYKKHQQLVQTFQINDLVWLKNNQISSAENQQIKKFFPLYVGPFRIKKVIHSDTFLLEHLHTKKERGIFNLEHIKKVY